MRVAAVHFGKRGADPASEPETRAAIDGNEARLIELLRRAARDGGAELIVTPELPIVHLSPQHSPFQHSSERSAVQRSRGFARWLVEERCPRFQETLRQKVVEPFAVTVVTSVLAPLSGTSLIVSAGIVLTPGRAEPIHAYHKRMLTAEPTYAVRGASTLEPVETPIGALGVLVCSDYSVPLLSRAIALNGAQLIVVPADLTSRVTDALRARAWENGVPLVLANAFDAHSAPPEEYAAESAMVGANASIIWSHRRALDTYEVCELAAPMPILRRRRPELYAGALSDLTAKRLRPPREVTGVTTIAISEMAHEPASLAEDGPGVVLAVLPPAADEQTARRQLSAVAATGAHAAAALAGGGCVLFVSPGGECVSLATDDSIERYVDVGGVRIGLLTGDDLLLPEVVEAHRNAGVDLLLISSDLGFDAEPLFRDVALSRHMSVAVAGRQSASIYQRYPDAAAVGPAPLARLSFDASSGSTHLAPIERAGLEVIARQ